jgi:GDP-mannose 6-dehydrogenase
LSATTSAAEAIERSDLSFICVGTPSRDNGSLNLDYVERVIGDIGAALRDHARYHVVAVRSTVLPGTVEEKLVPSSLYDAGKLPASDTASR